MRGKIGLPPAAVFAFLLLALLLTSGEAAALPPAAVQQPAAVQPQPLWRIEKLINTKAAGDCSVTQLDSKGRAHIIYFNADLKTLYYLYFTGSAWSSPQEVDSARRGHTMCYSGMVLQSTGKPAVVYTSDDNQLFYTPMTCSTATNCAFHPEKVVVNLPGALEYPALALDGAGQPQVLFRNQTHLIFVYKTFGGWKMEQPLKSEGTNVLVGGPPINLLRDTHGNLHASYYCMKHYPWYLERTSAGWKVPERMETSTDNYDGIALALDSTQSPHLAAIVGAYRTLKLYSPVCSGGTCTWAQQPLDQLPDTAATSELNGVRLVFDKNNYPRLSYYYRDASGKAGLKYIYYNGQSYMKMMIDPRVGVGHRSWLTLTATGQSRISYFEGGSGGLNFANEAANLYFIPTIRR